MPRYHQGKFKPRNPKKYMGDVTNIVYRSGWELKLMNYLDTHGNVTKWGSETLVIPYVSPLDNRIHRYFTDFYVERINRETSKKEVIIIEVKPKAQTTPPDFTKKMTKAGGIRKSYIREVKTWGVNEAKWKAAKAYCDDRGWVFQIMSEKELGIK
ncbi:MAG: head completion protein [Robiginitomaculum sp.]|nr:MAG: head completion protein [Robiginitomaculum sp.]